MKQIVTALALLTSSYPRLKIFPIDWFYRE